MNDKLRSILGIFVIVLIFVLSFVAYDHIDSSYLINEPEYVNELEAANDSLETLILDLEEQKDELTEELDDLKEEITNEK